MNRSSGYDEIATKMESMYPSLDEVEVIPMPSLGDVFRDAEQQQQHEQAIRISSQPKQVKQRQVCSSQSSTSSGSRGKHRDKPASVGTFPVSNASQKRPPLQRLKSSDLLDAKPSALTRPASSPGAVEVTTVPYIMYQHQQHESYHQVNSPQMIHHSYAADSSSRRPWRDTSSFPRMELEVSPGVFLPLHGSDETYSAMREGRLCPTYCLACETPLFCVEYAAQVLCPNCRVVSPVFTHQPRHHDYSNLQQVGVGLGMTVEEYDGSRLEFEERRSPRYCNTYYHDH